MKLRSFSNGLCALLLATSTLASATGLKIFDPWVREAPPGASALAAYMVLENSGDTVQVLTGISSPVSDSVEIHRTIITDGVARMVQQQSVTIPPGEKLTFESGGYHIMVMNPPALKAGERVPFTLQLQDGSTVDINAEVRRVMGGQHNPQHHH